MSVYEKMTAIATEIRELSGIENKLGLDEMSQEFRGANQELGEIVEFQKKLLNPNFKFISFKFNFYANTYKFTCPEGTTWREFKNFYPDESASIALSLGSDGYIFNNMFYSVNVADTSVYVMNNDVIIEGATYTMSLERHPDTMW